MPLTARIVIAGTHSGVGKTTVATGVIAALRRAGHRPAAAKIGPDFIDPGYHALASGLPPRNLDAWLCGAQSIPGLAGRAAAASEVLIVEGVMGLFDGAGDGTVSSTADVARLLDAPVVLVIDAAAMSGSVAALVHGFTSWDQSVRIAGVVLNRVGSPGHEEMLREALMPTGIPVIGALMRDDAMTWRDRHLGLVPVVEEPGAVSAALDRLATRVGDGIDLKALLAIARSAPPLEWTAPTLPAPQSPCRIAVAGGAAFNFTYTDTLEVLAACGAEIVPFDPLVEQTLPAAIDGLFIGGGFPEVYGPQLSANKTMLRDLAGRIGTALPTWAECGGLLLLSESLDDVGMGGVVATRARMTGKLTLGYRKVTTAVPSFLGPVGTELRGHEFHYSTCDPGGHALLLSGRGGERREGWAGPSLVATYVHHHPGGDPSVLASFARACQAYSRVGSDARVQR